MLRNTCALDFSNIFYIVAYICGVKSNGRAEKFINDMWEPGKISNILYQICDVYCKGIGIDGNWIWIMCQKNV